jgi:FkbM family methyltransferase
MGFRMCLNLADFVVSGAVLNDGYEPHETDFIRRTVRPGQVVLDIGANIGYFTLLMAHLVGAAGYVYAFEPREDLCGFVKRSIAENHYEDRCAIFTCALGDFEGVCNFRMAGKSGLDPSDPNYHSSCYLAMNEAGGDKHEFCDVEVKILDCLLSDSFDKRVAFIKIDAEGAEHMIFRGARNLLKRDKPIILSEVFEPLLRDVSKADAVTYVKSVTAFGYECYVFENGALTPMGSVERFFKSEASRVKPVNVVFNPAK